MTLILNLLHKDFSILVADRRASSSGPVTLEAGNLVVTATKGITIDGFNRLFLSKDSRCAIWVSGAAEEHVPYVSDVQRSVGVHKIREIIHGFLVGYPTHESSAKVRFGSTIKLNAGILTYFEPTIERFYTQCYEFSLVRLAATLCTGEETVTRFTVGSGSIAEIDEKANVRFEEYHQSIKTIADIDMGEIKAFYKAVSDVDPDVGTEISVLAASRSALCFTSTAI